MVRGGGVPPDRLTHTHTTENITFASVLEGSNRAHASTA